MDEAAELEKLVVELVGDSSDYDGMMREVERITKDATQTVERESTRMVAAVAARVKAVSTSLRAFGQSLSLYVTAPLVAAGFGMVKMASDAEETSSKFNVVFRDIADDANQMAEELDKSFGMSSVGAKRLLGDTGDLLTGFGFAQDQALELSGEVQKLAVDLASFTNYSGGAEGASRALTKALLGEREGIKALGIAILEEDVKMQMAQDAAAGLTFETERQAKAFATLAIAQRQSKNAIGDYARTQDSFANQFREFRADLEDLAVSFGEVLLGPAKELISWVRDLVGWFKELSPETKQVIVYTAAVAAAVGPLVVALGMLGGAVAGVIGGFTALAPIAVTLAPYVAVIGAIAAAVGGLVYLVVGPEGLSNAWETAKSSVGSFVEAAMGFMANFSTNMTILWEWLKDNWFNVLKDIGSMFLTISSNMIQDAAVVVEGLVRTWAFLEGYLAQLFQKIFSQEFVNWVVDGIMAATDKFVEFVQWAWTALKSIFTGETDLGVEAFFNKIMDDAVAGMETKDPMGDLQKIWNEQAKKLKSPLEGFESSIIEGPQFVLDRMKDTVEPITTDMNADITAVKTAIDEVKKEAEKPVVMEFKTAGVNSLLADSAEFAARMDAYRRLPTIEATVTATTTPSTAPTKDITILSEIRDILKEDRRDSFIHDSIDLQAANLG